MTDAYRPTTFDEVVGQPTDEIEPFIDGANTPNFLFHGPAGTGKTSTARVIAREIQGDENELMELNNSDERGIDTVRDRVIPTVKQPTLTGAPRVIFLDEMDGMTKDAQEALRQPMESSPAVFILACNDLDSVHHAVQSRCHVKHFSALDARAVKRRVKQLAASDGVPLTAEDLSEIVSFARGDMRKAIQRYREIARGLTGEDEDTMPDSLERSARAYIGAE